MSNNMIASILICITILVCAVSLNLNHQNPNNNTEAIPTTGKLQIVTCKQGEITVEIFIPNDANESVFVTQYCNTYF